MQLPSVQSLLKKYGVRPKRRFGQNFLIAQPTMLKIVDAVGASRDDVVLEIGCGMGVMTAMLSERCKRVLAVDADEAALDIAREEFGSLQNIEWTQGDILDFDITRYAGADRLIVVGNIPYNISSPILFHLADHRTSIRRAVLMMQKEVAERVAAKPGGKPACRQAGSYGALSVMMQSYAACKKLFNVTRTNFMPQPKVTSSVIELSFVEGAPPEGLLRNVVQAAFQQRRKTLRNALLGSSLNIAADDLDHILAELEIDPKRRPETLSVHEFHRLAEQIALLC